MATPVQCRQEEMSCVETKEKEKGDDLSLFVDFNGANLNIDLHKKSNQFEEIFDSESDQPMMPETRLIITHDHNHVAVDLLNSEKDTTDYDWLLSPPRNSVTSLEMEEQKILTGQHLISNGQSTSPKTRLENPTLDTTSTTKVKAASKLPSSSIKSSNPTIRRPSPSRKPPSTVSRSSTPTTRPTIPSTTKPSRSSTPTSRPTIPPTKPLPSSKRSTTPTRPARSSTPTARPSVPPASKSTSRSSTPTPRPSLIATSKSASTSTSRSSTPTQRPTNSSANVIRSTSVTKARASIKKPLPERPASASRGRPETVKPIPKRTSSSPSRGPVSNGVKTGVMKNRGYSNGNDEVNPVLMGTKMVERVVNMRKLAPPRDDRVVNQNNTSGKLSVSQDNAGFGRTLSKKSFDMALRHLDIRRSMPGNMRAMITKIPASSVYSVRSESVKSHTISASDSPLATSSSASSDHSIGNNPSFVDGEITNKISMGFENGH